MQDRNINRTVAGLFKIFSDGKRCIFRLTREREVDSADFELVLLVDNHTPFGFHYHDKLPYWHDSRKRLETDSWQEAWSQFQAMVKELLDGQT